MLETLGRVLLFFMFVGLGALLVRTGRLKSEGLDGMSAFFYWLGFPAYLIHALSNLPRPDSAHAVWLGLYIAGFLLAGALCFVLARGLKSTPGESMGAAMAAFVPNTAFLGLPIATNLFGPEVMQSAPILFIADFLVLFFIGCAGLSTASGFGPGMAVKRTFKNPTVLASIFGVGLMLTGIRLPPLADQFFDLAGRACVPVALVTLGGMLGLMPARRLMAFSPTTLIAVGGKLLLAPALMALVMYLAGMPPLLFQCAVFMAACPTAVSVFVQTRVYGLWFEGSAIAIAQSTVLSLLTLSGLALLLTHG